MRSCSGNMGAMVLREICGRARDMTAQTIRTEGARMIAELRQEFARRGIPWLAPEEEAALLAYLARHAGG